MTAGCGRTNLIYYTRLAQHTPSLKIEEKETELDGRTRLHESNNNNKHDLFQFSMGFYATAAALSFTSKDVADALR